MKTRMLIKARQLWATGNKSLDRRNRREWIRAIRKLGDKWLLARYVEKRT